MTIESGIPPPAVIARRGRPPKKEYLEVAKLEVGDSIWFASTSLAAVKSAFSKRPDIVKLKHDGWQFVFEASERHGVSGVRVWRVL